MKRKNDIPFGWLLDFVHRLRHGDEHHRVCRLCHKPIRRHEHWRQVKVGWFAPVYTVEHRDCAHPTAISHAIPVQTVPSEPELPFDGTVWAGSGRDIDPLNDRDVKAFQERDRQAAALLEPSKDPDFGLRFAINDTKQEPTP